MFYNVPTVDRNTINKIISTIDGWYFENEAYALASYAQQVKQHCIVEIGSYKGRSTVILGYFSPFGTPVYSIDPHIPSPDESMDFGNHDRSTWTLNIVEWHLTNDIKPINLRSQDVASIWQEPIELLFVDGAHNYDSVKADLDGYVPHVVHDGIIAVHDINRDQIQKALTETQNIELVKIVDLTGFYRKIR